MTVPTKVRDAVYERDGYRCYHCGTSLGLSPQHIKNRSQGGTDDPSNLITMCWAFNTAMEGDVEAARMGRIFGWKRLSWQRAFPVYDRTEQVWYQLSNDYSKNIATPTDFLDG